MMSAAVFLFPSLAHFTTLVIDGVNRLATSASDILIWESLNFGDFPDVLDKPYPLVAEQVDLRPLCKKSTQSSRVDHPVLFNL